MVRNQLEITQSLLDYDLPYLILIDDATPHLVSHKAIAELSKTYAILYHSTIHNCKL